MNKLMCKQEAEQQLFQAVEEKKTAVEKERVAFNKVLPCADCGRGPQWPYQIYRDGLCISCYMELNWATTVFSCR